MNHLPKIGQIIIFEKPSGKQIAVVNRLFDTKRFEVVYARGQEKRAMILSVYDHYVLIPKTSYYFQKIVYFSGYFLLLVITFSFWLSVLSNWYFSCPTNEIKTGWFYTYSVVFQKNCDNFWKVFLLKEFKIFSCFLIFFSKRR